VQFIVMVLRWVARLGQRAEAESMEEILLHHGFEYWDPRFRDLEFSTNLWKKPSREGDLYVYLASPGVDESVLIWERRREEESALVWAEVELILPEAAPGELYRNFIKIPVAELDATLAQRCGTPQMN